MKTKLCLTIFFTFSLTLMYANTNKYRLTLRGNPATSIVVGWNQVSGNNAVVYYGTNDFGTNWNAYPNSKTVDRSENFKGMNNRFARLTGLLPNTNYYFVIRDSQSISSRFWFRTSSDNPSDRLSFIAGGDSRNNRTPRINANKLVAKLKPNAVLFGGDMTNGDSNTEWNAWFEDWQHTIASDGRMFPIIATRGNHESSNNSIYNLFDVPSSSVYYAITFGGSLIRSYTLNTEISISGTQTNWLASDLQANNTIWKIAQYHKPMRPHVSSKSEGNSQYSNWASLFYNNGVKLVVECDAHTVKTTWPVRPTTARGNDEGFVRDNNGTVYAGEGCWGAPLRSNNDNKSWTRDSGRFNQFKWIFVDQNQIEIRTVKTDGADQVSSVESWDVFTPPAGLELWNPSNGAVVTIEGNLSAPEITMSSPTNQTSYSSPQNITLSANATDADGRVVNVSFFANGNLIASDTTSPYRVNYTIPSDGRYLLTATATDNDGNITTSSTVVINVGVVNQVIEKRIVSSLDDVEESGNNGTIYTDSSDLELTRDGLRGSQTIGLRFTGINIPKGALINKAYVQFTTDETTSEATNLTIKGQNINNAPAFNTTVNNVSNRSTTLATVNWTPSAWNNSEASGISQRTADIKSIIQEIINRSGWNSGNNIALIISGTGKRVAESFDGMPSNAPLIHIEYTVGNNSNNPPSNTTQVLDQRIAGNLDDVEENANDGSIYTNSSDIELVNDGSRGNQIIGLRFTGINVPKNVRITNAYLQFTTDETSSETTNLTIKGQNVNNAPPFTTVINNVSNRRTTSAMVNWRPLPWNSNGAAGISQRTPDIKAIVQEIVNRSGWNVGNSLVFIITGTGRRTARSYDNRPNSAALLHIEYEQMNTGNPVCSSIQVNFNNFESGYGIWNDGGSDCTRVSNTAYANSGVYSVRLRDNSSESFTNTDNMNLTNFENITLSFSYYCNSMDNSNEDFMLQISSNGGNSYRTIEEWNRGDEFENNIRYNDAVTISGPFTSNTSFRFICDASSNGDQVFIDDIAISGCGTSLAGVFRSAKTPLETVEEFVDNLENSTDIETLKIYPNPFKNSFTIFTNTEKTFKATIRIFDVNGNLVINKSSVQLGSAFEIQTQVLQVGIYILEIQTGHNSMFKKIVKRN